MFCLLLSLSFNINEVQFRWRLACCCRLLKLFSCHVSSSLFKDQSLPTVAFVVMNLCIDSWYLNIYSEVLALHSNVIFMSCPWVRAIGITCTAFSSQLKLAICRVEVLDQLWVCLTKCDCYDCFALHLPILVCASANDLMSINMEDMEQGIDCCSCLSWSSSALPESESWIVMPPDDRIVRQSRRQTRPANLNAWTPVCKIP